MLRYTSGCSRLPSPWPVRSPESWHGPRSVTKMFAGLMSRWTMPLACAASSASAISMASEKQDVSISSGLAADRVLQGHAVEKLHGDEGAAVLLANVVDRADVGMVQRGSGLRFAPEALQRLRVAAPRRRAKT